MARRRWCSAAPPMPWPCAFTGRGVGCGTSWPRTGRDCSSRTAAPGQVLLAWTAPPSGASPITDYVVRYYQGTSTSGGSWTLDLHSASPGCTITGQSKPGLPVTPGQTYTFTVQAESAEGYGLPSAPVTVTLPS